LDQRAANGSYLLRRRPHGPSQERSLAAAARSGRSKSKEGIAKLGVCEISWCACNVRLGNRPKRPTMRARRRAAFVAICSITAATATPASWGRRITLNDTGMTRCVTHQKQWSSDCAKSRQDASYGRDVTNSDPEDGVAGFSFRKVCHSGEMAGEGSCPADPVLGSGPDEWGCTHDSISNLTWEVKTADGGVHDYLRRYTNKGHKGRDDDTDAAWLVDTTNAEALCGATNWRLPDTPELHSIVDYGMGTPETPGDPFIDATFFPYDAGLVTWTREGLFNDPKRVWFVDFRRGWISAEQRSYSLASARLVHGIARAPPSKETAAAKARFIPSDDGTEVRDTLTGLVWKRCIAGMVWNNEAQACTGTATRFGWNSAFDYAKANRQGGWRLPNAKELFSVVDSAKQGPAIDEFAFPNTPTSVSFFSSTPLHHAPNIDVHTVEFFRGFLNQQEAFGNDSWLIRLVRSGRQ
jgi:hypothetical protein